MPRRIATFAFTGDGAEYFRIWVVNLLLTISTLGIYSAWAKVRKMRYFCQNTRLEGHAFDYHGDARAILLGRVIALVLLLGYTFASDISRATALVMVGVLCAVGPWLFMRAQRFRLANSSWRGLRFGFDAQTLRGLPCRPASARHLVLERGARGRGEHARSDCSQRPRCCRSS